MNDKFSDKVYDVVKSIPHGKVMSYGHVAMRAGFFGAARAVGRVLHNNPDPMNTPCHRVVFADGKCSTAFAFGGINEQYHRLKAEGVQFVNDKVQIEYFVKE